MNAKCKLLSLILSTSFISSHGVDAELIRQVELSLSPYVDADVMVGEVNYALTESPTHAESLLKVLRNPKAFLAHILKLIGKNINQLRLAHVQERKETSYSSDSRAEHIHADEVSTDMEPSVAGFMQVPSDLQALVAQASMKISGMARQIVKWLQKLVQAGFCSGSAVGYPGAVNTSWSEHVLGSGCIGSLGIAHFDFAYYSREVYKSNGGETLPGWKKLYRYNNTYKGLAWCAYAREDQPLIMVAFRGTSPKDATTIFPDALLAMNEVSPQHREGLEIVKKIILENIDGLVVVTGHSLGASIAAYAACNEPLVVEAVLLESPGLPVKEFDKCDHAKITTYNVAPNRVNTLHKPLGTTFHIRLTQDVSDDEKWFADAVRTSFTRIRNIFSMPKIDKLAESVGLSRKSIIELVLDAAGLERHSVGGILDEFEENRCPKNIALVYQWPNFCENVWNTLWNSVRKEYGLFSFANAGLHTALCQGQSATFEAYLAKQAGLNDTMLHNARGSRTYLPECRFDKIKAFSEKSGFDQLLKSVKESVEATLNASNLR